MMEILESLNRRNDQQTIYCPWRKRHVPALPEELVRMQLLQRLINDLGYPESQIAVERKLDALVCGSKRHLKLPSRRLDIVCFTTEMNASAELLPLLLIECKAVNLTSKMENQVIGYNHYLEAPFVSLVNQFEARTAAFVNANSYRFLPGLPSYAQLVKLRTWS